MADRRNKSSFDKLKENRQSQHAKMQEGRQSQHAKMQEGRQSQHAQMQEGRQSQYAKMQEGRQSQYEKMKNGDSLTVEKPKAGPTGSPPSGSGPEDATFRNPDGSLKNAPVVATLEEKATRLQKLKNAVKAARMAGRATKLSVVAGVAAAGTVAYLISDQFDEQRDYARQLCAAGKIDKQTRDDYIKLNGEIEDLVQIENAAAVGPTFILTAPLLELEIERRFQDFADNHKYIEQDQLDLLSMGTLDVMSFRTQFDNELKKMQKNGDLPPALNDLGTALAANTAAQEAFEEAIRKSKITRGRHGNRHATGHEDANAAIEPARTALKAANEKYRTTLSQTLADPEKAKALFKVMKPEVQKEWLDSTAQFAVEGDDERILRLKKINEILEVSQQQSRYARGTTDRSGVAELKREKEGILNELIKEPAVVAEFITKQMTGVVAAGVTLGAQIKKPAGNARVAQADAAASQQPSSSATRAPQFNVADHVDDPRMQLQLTAWMAKAGKYDAMKKETVGQTISKIDNKYGKRTAHGTHILLGSDEHELQAGQPAYKDQLSQVQERLKNNATLRDSVIYGLATSVKNDPEYVKAFLIGQSVKGVTMQASEDELNAAIQAYAERFTTPQPQPVVQPNNEAISKATDAVMKAHEALQAAQQAQQAAEQKIEKISKKITAFNELTEKQGDLDAAQGEVEKAEEIKAAALRRGDFVAFNKANIILEGKQAALDQRKEAIAQFKSDKGLEDSVTAESLKKALDGAKKNRATTQQKLDKAQKDYDDKLSALVELDPPAAAALNEALMATTASGVNKSAAANTVVGPQPEDPVPITVSDGAVVDPPRPKPAAPSISSPKSTGGALSYWEKEGVFFADMDIQMPQTLIDRLRGTTLCNWDEATDIERKIKAIYDARLKEAQQEMLTNGKSCFTQSAEVKDLDSRDDDQLKAQLYGKKGKSPTIEVAAAEKGHLILGKDGTLSLGVYISTAEEDEKFKAFTLDDDFVDTHDAALQGVPVEADNDTYKTLVKLADNLLKHPELMGNPADFNKKNGVAIQLFDESGVLSAVAVFTQGTESSGAGLPEKVKVSIYKNDAPKAIVAMKQTPKSIAYVYNPDYIRTLAVYAGDRNEAEEKLEHAKEIAEDLQTALVAATENDHSMHTENRTGFLSGRESVIEVLRDHFGKGSVKDLLDQKQKQDLQTSGAIVISHP